MSPPGRDFLLLLNESLLPHVVGLPTPARRRLREKLEFLGAGLWDAGIRVKKLKGLTRKVVFEARLSKGDRLLFTLGRDRERALVYVWSLVSHDDIGRGAERVGAQNAPFLQLEAEEAEEREEIVLADLPEEYYTQEPLEAAAREEYGPQKWLVLDDAEWERLLRASDPDGIFLHLYLTREQERFLRMEPPLLLSGTAGSGKTTICVYYLLRPEYRDGRRLFVTYSPWLQRFSERIYRGLVSNAPSPSPEGAAEPEFLVFRDLVSRLLGEKEGGSPTAAGYREFERIYAAHTHGRSQDPELVWEEIRSIIKGAKPALSSQRLQTLAQAYLDGTIAARELGELQGTLLDVERLELAAELRRLVPDYASLVRGLPARSRSDAERRLLGEAVSLLSRRSARLAGPLLSYAEYAELGAKRAPNFRYDRKAIYALAEQYQAGLEAGGLEDDVDRARRAIALLCRGGGTRLYDLVICDEVQDFCDVEVSLLLRLGRSAGGVVLAGDVKQTINPSGFRWEEVRRSFFERGVETPEVLQLSLNFRCVGGIVRLANAILGVKQRLVGLHSSEVQEEWKFSGRPPLLLAGPEEQAVLREVDLRVAGRIVIVRSREEKERLRATLHSELVFTIYEAKGLEFDTVLLWRFLDSPGAAGIWRRVSTGREVEHEHAPHLRQELNLLYVAVTRARNGLVVYDGEEPSPVWGLEEIGRLLLRSADPADLALAWQHASTPEEWERQGEHFLEREQWKAAAECFRNAGDPVKARTAEARGLEAEGRQAEAAALYETNGMHEAAASCWEAAGELERAMATWKRLGQGERFRLCRVRLYERQGEHERAAAEWEKLGNLEGALRNWELAGMWERVGGVWLEWKQHGRAAEAFERAGLLVQAAEILEKAKEPARAAALYERARAWERAAAVYRRMGDEARLLECLERVPDHRGAGELREKRGEISEAMASFRRLAAESAGAAAELEREAAEAEEKGGEKRRRAAAIRRAALGEHARAARLFEEAAELDAAIREWREAQDYKGMARCLAAQGKPAEAARLLELHDPAERDLVMELLRRASAEPESLEALWREAERMEGAGNVEGALLRYRVFDAEEKLVELYADVERDEEALESFLRPDRYPLAIRFLASKPRVRVGAAFAGRQVAAVAELARQDPAIWSAEGMAEAYARLLVAGLDAEPAVEGAAQQFLELLADVVGSSDSLPEPLVALMLRLHPYNAIQTALSEPHGRGTEGVPELREPFLARLRDEADSSGDRTLRASWASVMDPPAFDLLMGEIELTERTVRLFEASPAHHVEAAAYHREGGRWERAAAVHQRWGEAALAAEVCEQAGELREASALYREAGEHARAFSCAQRAGNEVEMARALEGLGELGRAADIWSSLGRSRDLERVRRRAEEGKTGGGGSP